MSPPRSNPRSVNEWRVETSVDANVPLAAVDARVNAGDWRPLKETDWGWADSFHVLHGAHVEFRATSNDGNATKRPPYRWPRGDPVEAPSSETQP
jgi:hypothetical protein